MDWLGLFLGWIPLWMWVTICIMVAAPVMYFFGPVLVPLWNMLPRPVKLFLEAVVLALLAWAGGRYVGAKRERDEQRRREESAIRNRAEVDQDVQNLSEKDTRDRLDRWNRD